MFKPISDARNGTFTINLIERDIAGEKENRAIITSQWNKQFFNDLTARDSRGNLSLSQVYIAIKRVLHNITRHLHNATLMNISDDSDERRGSHDSIKSEKERDE